MLIVGIDPGTATTGYGFLKVNGNSTIDVIRYGLIETSKDESPEKRLANIHTSLMDILNTHTPDIMAMEKVFFATNRKTAIRVGQAQGAIMLSAALLNIPLFEYAPGSIKKQVSGNGRADKNEMQKAVRDLLGPGIRKKKGKKTHFDNEADALAVALCHLKYESII